MKTYAWICHNVIDQADHAVFADFAHVEFRIAGDQDPIFVRLTDARGTCYGPNWRDNICAASSRRVFVDDERKSRKFPSISVCCV